VKWGRGRGAAGKVNSQGGVWEEREGGWEHTYLYDELMKETDKIMKLVCEL
jgi:hypothetical protein